MIALLLPLLLQDPMIGMPTCRAPLERVIRSDSSLLPIVGSENTADVGDPLLISTNYDVHEMGATLAEDVVFSGTTSRAPFSLTVPAGTRLILEGPGYNPQNYSFEGRGPNPTAVHVEGVGSGQPVARISWGFMKERHPITQGVFRILRGECVSMRSETLTRQLAFTGVSRGVVSVEYREFSGNLARPAFTQTATYDLSEGKIVGFRGARIEVLNADNVEIRYRVIKGFD